MSEQSFNLSPENEAIVRRAVDLFKGGGYPMGDAIHQSAIAFNRASQRLIDHVESGGPGSVHYLPGLQVVCTAKFKELLAASKGE